MAERFDLLQYAYAHRGLWGNDGSPPENSLAAYQAAADAGLGIEMDVRPSADGIPVCFHDATLKRMTGKDGAVSELNADVLVKTTLPDETAIPLFSDLLDIWPHDLPILVEIKIDHGANIEHLVDSVVQRVGAFPGKAAIMSFSEAAVSAIPENIMRGQLIEPASQIGKCDFDAKLARALLGGADYLGLHVSDAQFGVGQALPTVCWTVRTQAQRSAVRQCGHAEIYEHLPLPLADT